MTDGIKLCKKCNQYKAYELFYKSTTEKFGCTFYCKDCMKNMNKERGGKKRKTEQTRIISSKIKDGSEILSLENNNETIKAIVAALMEKPKISTEELAGKVGLKVNTMKNYMDQNSYIRALRMLASRKISSFIPLAIQGLKDSVESANTDVKYKASVRLLENEDVMGATKVDVTVNDLRNRPISELEEIVARAKTIPEQTIQESELIT